MMIVGALTYAQGFLIMIAQILGGIAASAVVSCMLPGPLNVRKSLGGDTAMVQGLFIQVCFKPLSFPIITIHNLTLLQMFLTAQLVFTIFMLEAEKHRATFIAPVGIGLSLFIAELMGVYYTGGSLNPARSFRAVRRPPHLRPLPLDLLGRPYLGGLLASGFYMFTKTLENETVNPEQDDEGNEVERLIRTQVLNEKLIHPVLMGLVTMLTSYHPRKNDVLGSADAEAAPGRLHDGRESDDTAVAARGLARGPAARRGRDLDLEAGVGSPLP